MECAQINITGGSGSKSPATVSIPGAYKATDPGILINIYQTLSSYTIPGPAPFSWLVKILYKEATLFHAISGAVCCFGS
jgi:hypothetical protein